jgi:hypothetical protein
MSYCRFENTLNDLQDCYESMDNPNLSPQETYKRKQLLELCAEIVEDYGIEINKEVTSY